MCGRNRFVRFLEERRSETKRTQNVFQKYDVAVLGGLWGCMLSLNILAFIVFVRTYGQGQIDSSINPDQEYLCILYLVGIPSFYLLHTFQRYNIHRNYYMGPQ